MDQTSRYPDPFPPPFADRWGDDRFGLWADLLIATAHGSAAQRLRWIEPGTFLMGSLPEEPERDRDEGPRHVVTLTRGFWLADTACTKAMWLAVTGEMPSQFTGGAQLPMEQVSWHDVQRFLRTLEGLVPFCAADLPTEAEWEYACRAGSDTPFSFGARIGPDLVNYDGSHPYAGGPKGSCRGEMVPVGSLPANAWGLYEMHGNVFEWCCDGRRLYDDKPQVDPRVPADGEKAVRVLRGGSWDGIAMWARSAYRRARRPRDSAANLGFRLCLRSLDHALADPDRGTVGDGT